MKGASWMDIRSDRQKGLSYVELGKKYCQRRFENVRNCLASGQLPQKVIK